MIISTKLEVDTTICYLITAVLLLMLWLCDLDLWPFDLEHCSYTTDHVINLSTMFDNHMPIRSEVMTSFTGYYGQFVCRHCTCHIMWLTCRLLSLPSSLQHSLALPCVLILLVQCTGSNISHKTGFVDKCENNIRVVLLTCPKTHVHSISLSNAKKLSETVKAIIMISWRKSKSYFWHCAV